MRRRTYCESRIVRKHVVMKQTTSWGLDGRGFSNKQKIGAKVNGSIPSNGVLLKKNKRPVFCRKLNGKIDGSTALVLEMLSYLNMMIVHFKMDFFGGLGHSKAFGGCGSQSGC